MEQKQLTGYPSIDKPWLKYYSEEAINAKLPECTVYEYLHEQNRQYPNDVALSYYDGKTTFGELFRHIDETAAAFSRAGVKRGDIVTLCTVTTPETVYAFYALNRLGAVSNMVDPRTNAEGIRHYLCETHSRVLLLIDAACPKIAKIVANTEINRVIVVSAGDSLPALTKLGYRLTEGRKSPKLSAGELYISWRNFIAAGKNGKPQYPDYARDIPAVIIHTGGTTGTPKGVELSNDNINAIAHQYYFGLETERRQKFLNIMPPFIAYGIAIGIHMPLCCGNTNILIPKFDPSEFDRLMIKYKPNHFCGVPTHFDGLLNSRRMHRFDLSFLVSAGVSGDHITLVNEEKKTSFYLTTDRNLRLQRAME